MALTLFEAAKLSRDPLIRGILLGVCTSDEMIAKLRFNPQRGMSYSFTREDSLSAPAFVSPTHTSITEGAAAFDQVTVPMRLAIGDVDTYIFVEEQMSELGSQKATQALLKLKALGRLLGDKLINGVAAASATLGAAIGGISAPVPGPNQDSDRFGPGSLKYVTAGTLASYRGPGDSSYGTAVNIGSNGTYTLPSFNPNKTLTITVVAASLPGANAEVHVAINGITEPDGLNVLMPASQVIASAGVSGDALTFDVLDQLIDEKVKTRDDLAFVGNAKLKRKFMGLLRSAGGLTSSELKLPGINGTVPSYRGVPFLQNDNIASTESKGAASNLSSIYCLDFGPQGIEAGCGMMAPQDINLGDNVARVMGIRMREVGELEAKEATRTRVSWYGAFGIKSKLSVGRAKEIVTA